MSRNRTYAEKRDKALPGKSWPDHVAWPNLVCYLSGCITTLWSFCPNQVVDRKSIEQAHLKERLCSCSGGKKDLCDHLQQVCLLAGLMVHQLRCRLKLSHNVSSRSLMLQGAGLQTCRRLLLMRACITALPSCEQGHYVAEQCCNRRGNSPQKNKSSISNSISSISSKFTEILFHWDLCKGSVLCRRRGLLIQANRREHIPKLEYLTGGHCRTWHLKLVLCVETMCNTCKPCKTLHPSLNA